MLNDFTGADKVYIACGYTDLRKGIDGLATMVQQQFELDLSLIHIFSLSEMVPRKFEAPPIMTAIMFRYKHGPRT